MPRPLLPWALALTLLLLGPRALAQDAEPAPEQSPYEALPAFDLERLALNPGRGTLLVGNGELLLPGTVRVALATHYQRAPLLMRVGGEPLGLVEDRVSGVLSAAVGVLPWLELDLHLPVVLFQRGDDPSSIGLAAPAARGLGTVQLQGRMGLLTTRAGQPLDLALDVGLGLPLGSTEALARERYGRLQPHVVLGRHFDGFRVALDAGLLLRVPGYLGPETLTNSRSAPELRLGGAVATVGRGLQGELTLRSALALNTGQVAGELLAGARYPLYPWLEVFGLGGLGLGTLPGTPAVRFMLGVSGGHPAPPRNPAVRRSTSSQQPLLPGSRTEQLPSRPSKPKKRTNP